MIQSPARNGQKKDPSSWALPVPSTAVARPFASSKPPSVRQQDAQGSIVATLDDYAAVRDLVVAAIAEGVEVTISPAVRETVMPVQGLHGEARTEAALREIAAALDLDDSATSRCIAAAIQLGCLRDPEERKGRPARACLRDAMPHEVPVLPEAGVPQCCGGSGV
jgi:hypothetical protein